MGHCTRRGCVINYICMCMFGWRSVHLSPCRRRLSYWCGELNSQYGLNTYVRDLQGRKKNYISRKTREVQHCVSTLEFAPVSVYYATSCARTKRQGALTQASKKENEMKPLPIAARYQLLPSSWKSELGTSVLQGKQVT